jgi:hypothetical protein
MRPSRFLLSIRQTLGSALTTMINSRSVCHVALASLDFKQLNNSTVCSRWRHLDSWPTIQTLIFNHYLHIWENEFNDGDDPFKNGMLSTDQGLASGQRQTWILEMTWNRPNYPRIPPSDKFEMKTWRGLSHRTLRTNTSIRWSSTIQKPANIASLLKSSVDNTNESSPEIEVNGYVRTIRKQKRIAFAAVGDGSSLQPVQAVLTPDQALS